MPDLGHRITLVCLAVLSAVWLPRLQGEAAICSGGTLTPTQKQSLVDYVRKKYKLPELIVLTLEKEDFLADSCFRGLTFKGKSEVETWYLKLYATPDLRFLAEELMDTRLDPQQQALTNELASMKELTQGATAVRGRADAPVTIIEFSDFQCPFCRKFATVLDETLAGGPQDVRVVFRHMPLRMHNWARVAAEGAACAQLQNPQAFWHLHDRVFRDQATLTEDNIQQKLNEFARDTKELDEKAFDQCMTNGMSLGLVLKDMNLAEANRVTGTPTIFINGHRVQPVESAVRLRELIAEARRGGAISSAGTGSKAATASCGSVSRQ